MAEDLPDMMNQLKSMLDNKDNIPENLRDILENFNSSTNEDTTKAEGASTSNNETSSNASNPFPADLLNNISPEMISGFMNMMNHGAKQDSNNSQTISEEELNQGTNSTNPFGNIDMGTIMKMKSMMDKSNSKSDPRSNLLLSLKPYLNNDRKGKVEQYIQLFNMTKMFDLFGTAGGDKKK